MTKPIRPALTFGFLLLLAACGQTGMVASKFIKSVDVGPAEGAFIRVTSADEPALAGAQLDIPSGAVATIVRVTLELGRAPIAARGAGPVAVWGPSGLHFLKQPTMKLPLSLPAGAVVADVYIEVLEANGQKKQIEPLLVEADFVTFKVDGFSSFQPAIRSAEGGLDGGGDDGCLYSPFDGGRVLDGCLYSRDGGGFLPDGGLACPGFVVDGGVFCFPEGRPVEEVRRDGGFDGGGQPPDDGCLYTPFDGGSFIWGCLYPDGGGFLSDGGLACDGFVIDGGVFCSPDGGFLPDGGLVDGCLYSPFDGGFILDGCFPRDGGSSSDGG